MTGRLDRDGLRGLRGVGHDVDDVLYRSRKGDLVGQVKLDLKVLGELLHVASRNIEVEQRRRRVIRVSRTVLERAREGVRADAGGHSE